MGRSTTRPHADPASALDAAMGAVSEAIRRVAREARFRAYDSHGAVGHHAKDALDAFLVGHDREAAISVIRAGFDGTRSLDAAVEAVRGGSDFRDVVSRVTGLLSERLPATDPGLAGRMARAACADELRRLLVAFDESHPLDLIDGEEVVICYLPGGSAHGSPLLEGLTSYTGGHSDCTTVRPDAAFGRFLGLANVSAPEYVAMVRRLRGVDVSALVPGWDDLSVPLDPARGHLVDEATLLDGIDGASYGFNPLVAFLAPARFLIERDWSQPLAIEGGIIGLHNFINGSGDPRRFEGRIVISPCPGDLMVAEGVSNDFSEVHGLQHDAFSSELSSHLEALARMAP